MLDGCEAVLCVGRHPSAHHQPRSPARRMRSREGCVSPQSPDVPFPARPNQLETAQNAQPDPRYTSTPVPASTGSVSVPREDGNGPRLGLSARLEASKPSKTAKSGGN
jgi:hypothetical protein